MAWVLTTLWNWLWGEQNATSRDIVSLEVIKTWADLYSENRQDFVDLLSEADALPEYTEDQEINAKVSIYSCDITSLKIDGIVRSTDASLTSTEGISGAIESAAGSKLNAELMSLGGCRTGQAKTTPGFDLPAKYIVHTVGTKQELPDILESCYKSCLEQMKAKNMKSLAFCCISTGIQGYPNDKAAQVALKTVRLWLEDLKTENKLDEIDRIVFCLFSEFDEMVYSFWMPVFFPGSPEPDATPLGICAPTAVTSTPEVDGTSSSGQNSGDIEDSIALENSIQLELKKQKLRPLSGFIEITTEPDMITLDDDPNTKRAKMPCGHVIGPDSMTVYFRDILKTGKFKFCCPMPNCNREWEYFLVRHVACLTDEEMLRFEKKLEKNFLQKEAGKQQCPGCKTWCERDPGARNCVRCPICTASRRKKFDFCWICLNEWKSSFPFSSCGNPGCNGKDKRIQILATCPTKRINYCYDCPTIRGCPKCGILIEHQSKCGHMNCNNCRYGFCFICLKCKKDGEWQCRPYFGTFGACKLAPRQSSLPGSR